jgi:hypothetical protein
MSLRFRCGDTATLIDHPVCGPMAGKSVVVVGVVQNAPPPMLWLVRAVDSLAEWEIEDQLLRHPRGAITEAADGTAT